MGDDIPTGWMEVASDGWVMIVPADWQPDPVFRPDSPFTSVYITRPSEAARRAVMPTSPPPTFRPLNKTDPPVHVPRPYLTLSVSRLPREGRDLEAATRRYARDSCYGCPPDLRRDQRSVDVHGRPGTLTEVVRADGSREWTLVAQNDCYTYAAWVRVVSGEVRQWSETVERILASARVDESGPLFGQCAT